MDTHDAVAKICARWREIWPIDNPRLPTAKQGVVCPICGSGSGKNKSGIKEAPWLGKHRLKCFRCGFFGDPINLLGREMGIEPRGHGFIIILEEGLRRLSDSSAIVVPPLAKEKPQTDYSAFYRLARAGLESARDFLDRRGISFATAQICGCGFVRDWTNPNGGKAKSPRFIMPCSAHNYFARDTRAREGTFSKIHIGNKTLYDPLHAISTDGAVFVVEGGIDAMAVIDAGGLAIALMGTDGGGLVRAAQKADFRGVFALALDNDNAGHVAAKKIQQQLAVSGFSCGFANICGRAKDPAEAHMLYPDQFTAMIARDV